MATARASAWSILLYVGRKDDDSAAGQGSGFQLLSGPMAGPGEGEGEGQGRGPGAGVPEPESPGTQVSAEPRGMRPSARYNLWKCGKLTKSVENSTNLGISAK